MSEMLMNPGIWVLAEGLWLLKVVCEPKLMPQIPLF
jgi:hypothetical protein